MPYTVYKHTTPNNKVYIGITMQKPKRRWRNYGVGYIYNEHFYRAILKYGWVNIDHEILFENLSLEDAIIKEKKLIAKYKSNYYKHGYNKTSGGEMGKTISEETRLKLSIAHKGQFISEETRRKIGEGNKGKFVSEKSREKMRIAATGRIMSEKAKAALERAINQYSSDGEFIQTFKSATYASKVLGLKNRSHIVSCCTGNRNKASGYKWSYADIDNENL